MPATVCPTCNHSLVAPEKYAGKMWRCPDCRTAFVVGGGPAGDAAPRPSRGRLWFILLALAIAALVAAFAFLVARQQ